MSTPSDTAVDLFTRTYGDAPAGVWAAPGRVNLIGEHTDYNAGLVLPIALPQRTHAAARKRDDGVVRLCSDGMDGVVEVGLGDIAPGNPANWARYPAGVLWALQGAGKTVGGLDVAFASDVPFGAGLSSSAAIEGAMAVAVVGLYGPEAPSLTRAVRPADNRGTAGTPARTLRPAGDRTAGTPVGTGEPAPLTDEVRAELAALCQKAENEIALAPTGGMDQAASLRSRAGHALYLDCADGSVTHVPFDLTDAGLVLLVVDTLAAHVNSDGQYGARRADCEEAARRLGFASLREVADDVEEAIHDLGRTVFTPGTADISDTFLGALSPALADLGSSGDPGAERLRRRVRHVVTEIVRVRAAAGALRAGDWDELGRLFTASHVSLRDDYEVSCPELDTVVDTALAHGALGARMTGGGFGGSAIALVRAQDVTALRHAITLAFAGKGFSKPPAFIEAYAAGPADRVR